jgi:hypothetical protein
MHSKLAILALPVLAAAYPQSSAVAPSPDQITIRDTTYSGSGCPQGSVSTSASDDKTVVTWGFDSFQTYIGPGTVAADKSKNCQLHLNLAYPGGFQYAVVDATYHGWARLDTGVTGSFITTYYFSQDAGKTVSRTPSTLLFFGTSDHVILRPPYNPLYPSIPRIQLILNDLANHPLLFHWRRRPRERPSLHQARQRRDHCHHLVPLRQQRHPQHQQPHCAY